MRCQLAFTVQSSPDLATAYAQLAARDFSDPWISAALLSAPPAVVNSALFPALTRDLATAKKSAAFVAKLIEIRAASAPAADRAALIDFVAQPGTSPLWLRALGEGLRRAGTTIAKADTAQKLTALFTRAAKTGADSASPTPARLAAIELLDVATYAQSREPLMACLASGQPAAIQSAAIKSLAQHTIPEVTAALIRAWPHYPPATKETALATLVAREDRATALLHAIKAGTIKPTELPATQVQSLTHHKSPSVIALAKTALASVIPPSRAEVTNTFQPAVTAAGDASRGRIQFQTRCIVCHQAGSVGGIAVGPDLLTVKTRGRDGLLTAILEPHKEVAPQYIAYDVTTKDGNAYTGMITRDDATGLSLKIMGGAEVVLPRANVRGSSSSGKSLMPEGLEAGMSVQDMADLLTFIEKL